jgi:hypothetical protein
MHNALKMARASGRVGVGRDLRELCEWREVMGTGTETVNSEQKGSGKR